MHRPDRIGVLILTFYVFSLYVDVANVVTSLAWASLPLGFVGSSWMGSTLIVTLSTVNIGLMLLYLNRQSRRAQRSPSVQK